MVRLFLTKEEVMKLTAKYLKEWRIEYSFEKRKLRVHDSLDLRDTQITSLPDGLSVDKIIFKGK
jgi:hypothetical protein